MSEHTSNEGWSIKSREILIYSRPDRWESPSGEPEPGHLLTCGNPRCGSARWEVFVTRSGFMHLKCVKCGAIYCTHEGECSGAPPGP